MMLLLSRLCATDRVGEGSIVPKKTAYHKTPRLSKPKKVSRPIEKQLQLPLQPLFRQFEHNLCRHRRCRWAFGTALVITLVILSLLLSTMYYHRQYSSVASDMTIKVREYTPVIPQTIEDIIDQQTSDENISETDSNTASETSDITEPEPALDQVYDLYEEKLPEENHINEAEIPETPAVSNENQPLITIVIDDMGISVKHTQDISSLTYPLTVSFLTYANNLQSQMSNSSASGQEIMAHLPMEPKVMQNFTPTMLTTTMSDKEVKDTLRNMLDLFPSIVAVNNHMGSKFTEDKHRMAIVMKELAKRNLIFLDSKTTPHSAGKEEAARFGVKIVERNVFLDNKDDFDYIMGQLHQTEEIAHSRGYAIAIGHPKTQTYLALKSWLPTLAEKGIKLVPLSQMSEFCNQN